MAAMARTLRALAPRQRASLGDGWVRPHWIERAGGPQDANGAHRRWTVIGNLDSPARARVDLRGLVSVDGEAWALDWWIGAEDRWHVPAREASVRQVALGSAPVVETRLRVPGGDAVQRVFAARDAGGHDVVVMEIENATKVPFAVALSIRPYDLDGIGAVRHLEAAGRELVVDGRLGALLPAAPRHAAASLGSEGDVAEVVFSGGAPDGAGASATCPEGLATLAVLHPLAHAATLRVVLPLGDERPDTASLPDVGSVVSGWQAHSRAGTRIELPDRRLQAAIDSSLRHLLLRADDPGPAEALDRFGFHDRATGALSARAGDPAAAAPGASLAVVTEHWSVGRDPDVARVLAPGVAHLVTALAHEPSRRRRPRGARRTAGTADRRRGLGRLTLAAELLDAAGETRAANDVRRTRQAARLDAPDALAADIDQLRVADAAVLGVDGNPDPAATLVRAREELAAVSWHPAQARLSWVLGAASGTWTWPTAIPASDPRGGLGDGHDVAAGAALLLLVRDVLVDDGEDSLALSQRVPDAWLGQGWELHDAPTTHGRLSYAVRWHGDRPALLWDLELLPGQPPVRLTSPGLDPDWSSTQPRGEALLGPVARPERPARRGLTIPVSIEPTPRGRR
jgi:hypothetical protein